MGMRFVKSVSHLLQIILVRLTHLLNRHANRIINVLNAKQILSICIEYALIINSAEDNCVISAFLL